MNNRGSKSQMKCFKCRQLCALKDGNWHHSNTGEVFLCRTCEAVQKGQPTEIPVISPLHKTAAHRKG